MDPTAWNYLLIPEDSIDKTRREVSQQNQKDERQVSYCSCVSPISVTAQRNRYIILDGGDKPKVTRRHTS